MSKNRQSITFMIGSSLAAMVFLPVLVAATAIYGFFNFKSDILDFSEHTIPQIISISTLNSQLAYVLFHTEKLSTANSQAQRRITFDEMVTQFENIELVSKGNMGPEFDDFLEKQLTVLVSSQIELNQLVEELINVNDLIESKLSEAHLIFEQAATLKNHSESWATTPQKKEYLARWIISISSIISAINEINTNQNTREINKQNRNLKEHFSHLDDALVLIPDDRLAKFKAIKVRLEKALINKDGLIPLLKKRRQLIAKTTGKTNFSINMVKNIESFTNHTFLDLKTAAFDKAETTAQGIDYQTKLLIVLVIIAGAMTLFVYLFFNTTLTRRLLKLNNEVLERISGKNLVISEAGNDEISDIASSVNYFASELNQAIKVAEESNRTKSLFLANMSHELRSPLNAIMGFSQVLERETFGPLGNKNYKEYAGDILTSGEHLLGVINSLLDLSKIEAGKFELMDSDVDLYAAAVFAEHVNTHIADKNGVQINVINNASDVLFSGDIQIIRQILLNLVSNAVKFTAEQGSVTITIGLNPTDGFCIIIKDSGVGMTSEQISTAASPFGQIHDASIRKHQGTGLGLPLTIEFVELHGGTVDITSTPGDGTVITVNFPPERTLRT